MPKNIAFLNRLILIVENAIKSGMGEWLSNGKGFYVYNRKSFAKFIKPYLFSTFKRQLNYYHFEVEYSDGFIFRHKYFNQSNYMNSSLNLFKINGPLKTKKSKRKTYKNMDKNMDIITDIITDFLSNYIPLDEFDIKEIDDYLGIAQNNIV